MKEYRKNELSWLAAFYTLTFLSLNTSAFNVINTHDNVGNLVLKLVEGLFVSSIIPLFTFIIDCLISSEAKNKLVGLFFIHRTGEKIFSIIKNDKFKDYRINASDIKKNYSFIISKIPKNKKERYAYENYEWYHLYKNVESEVSVIQAQKDYLTCRDMFVQSLFVLLLYPLSILLFHNVQFSLSYLVILIFMVLVTNIATQIKMKAFVYNVIITDYYMSLL